MTKKTLDILTSSGDKEGSYEWGTPDKLFADISYLYGPFDLDPAASKEYHVVDNYFDIKDDGLKMAWDGRVFCNPPYGKGLDLWVAKAYEEYVAGRAPIVVMLLPARTSTAWFHQYAHNAKVYFIKGRVAFKGLAKGNAAPFPSMIMIMAPTAPNQWSSWDLAKPPLLPV